MLAQAEHDALALKDRLLRSGGGAGGRGGFDGDGDGDGDGDEGSAARAGGPRDAAGALLWPAQRPRARAF